MTLDAQIRDFQEHARRSLQGGHPSQALDLLTQARELDQSSATTLMLQAIAMSNLRQIALATETFAQAIAIAPADPKIHYNYALHLYSFGFRNEALALIEENLELNPTHIGSIELKQRIQGDPATRRDPGHLSAPRGGYDQDANLHTIKLIAKVGPAWDVIGWLLAALSVMTTVYGIRYLVAMGDPNFRFTVHSTVSTFQALYLICLLGTIFFGVIDLADRRGQFAWLIPLVTLPAMTLGWVALPLYLFSRKR